MRQWRDLGEVTSERCILFSTTGETLSPAFAHPNPELPPAGSFRHAPPTSHVIRTCHRGAPQRAVVQQSSQSSRDRRLHPSSSCHHSFKMLAPFFYCALY